MSITSPPRAAAGGALLAVAAGLFAPNNLVAFYLTALAAGVLMFAAFMAYLAAQRFIALTQRHEIALKLNRVKPV